MRKKNIVLVSALLPVSVREEKKGQYEVSISPGGLITTLSQSIANSKVVWFGWYGYTKYSKKLEDVLIKEGKKQGFNLNPVHLSEDEVEHFFNNFSNGVIWPLFHTFPQYCRFDSKYWAYYKKVNEKFAQKILSFLKGKRNYTIWVHDYHFFLLPSYIKQKRKDLKVYFFLHIPFPTFENFLKLPWRKEIIDGLLHYDFLGFHTKVDMNNFVQSVTHFYDFSLKEKKFSLELVFKDKKVRLSAIPISIDFDKYNTLAKDKEVELIYKQLEKRYMNRHVILSIDRIDYTKGLVEKLDAYRVFLKRYPEYKEKVVMLVSTAPNIKKLPEYTQLEQMFHHKIAEINGTFGTDEWRPVHFINKRLQIKELIAYYRFSDVCFINSIKDGLNIVCKEYAASNIDMKGAVLLSEFAGASTELWNYVYLINPYDYENTASKLAYVLNNKNRSDKMKKLREHIKTYNIHWWGKTFFSIAEGKKVDLFPDIKNVYPLHER